VRIDKPLGGARVCRTCIAHSRIQKCVRCGARREPVTCDEDGRPVCANADAARHVAPVFSLPRSAGSPGIGQPTHPQQIG
jgi:hypothetical protein